MSRKQEVAAEQEQEVAVCRRRRPRAETPLEALSSICAVLAIGLFVMTFVFQNFVIPSGSMEKTLLIGDHVLVDRITFAPPTRWAPFVHYREPQRGDVIVFLKPNPETPDLVLVKRLIGVPGDHIHLLHGVVYLNGVAQNEPYAALPREGLATIRKMHYTPTRDDFPAQGVPYGSTQVWTEEMPSHLVDGDLVVPPGKVFAMGDNREHSLDGTILGVCAAGEHPGAAAVQLLVVRDDRGCDGRAAG